MQLIDNYIMKQGIASRLRFLHGYTEDVQGSFCQYEKSKDLLYCPHGQFKNHLDEMTKLKATRKATILIIPYNLYLLSKQP